MKGIHSQSNQEVTSSHTEEPWGSLPLNRIEYLRDAYIKTEDRWVLNMPRNWRLGENEVNILESISSDPQITINQLSETLKISTTAVENKIKKLKEKDILKRVGPPRGGHWEIMAD